MRLLRVVTLQDQSLERAQAGLKGAFYYSSLQDTLVLWGLYPSRSRSYFSRGAPYHSLKFGVRENNVDSPVGPTYQAGT